VCDVCVCVCVCKGEEEERERERERESPGACTYDETCSVVLVNSN